MYMNWYVHAYSTFVIIHRVGYNVIRKCQQVYLTHVNDSLSHVWKSPTTHKNKCVVNIIHYLGHLWFCDISMWTSPITYMNALMNLPCHKYKCTYEPSSHADQYMRHKNSYERLCHVTNMHNGFPDIFTTLSL